MTDTLKLGTRGSQLAMWQSNWVKSEIERNSPGLSVELVAIKTTGDRILDVPLAQVGGKGLFTKELDEALLGRRIDIAVHSLKDVPFQLPAGLEIAAVPEREEPWDALISDGRRLNDMPAGSVIATSSLRRQVQIRRRFPSMKLVSLRGNVDTRLGKIEEGKFDGIILALAGLKRLGRAGRVTQVLDEETMLPAVGQGALAIVCRTDDSIARGRLSALSHRESEIAVTAERALLHVLEGSCQIPIAGLARISAGQIHIKGLVADLDGVQIIQDEIRGDPTHALELGAALGETLKRRGADMILAAIQAKIRDGTPR